MSIANQNIGKLHSYQDPHFNTEFDRIYDFLARVKFPDNSVDGVKLRDGSVAERKLRLPLSAEAAPGIPATPHRTDAEIDTLIEASVPYRWQTYALIHDEKPSNTAGGTYTAGAFRTRDLNTIIEDSGGIISLSANQITLEDGEYRILAKVPGTSLNRLTSRLQNITDAVTELDGTTERIQAAVFSMVSSYITGTFTVAGGPKTFEIQMIGALSQALVGMGFNTGFNSTEIYTIVELWQIETP